MEELKWESMNVLSKDRPSYRIMELKRGEYRRELWFVRTIEGEKSHLIMRCISFPYLEGIGSFDFNIIGTDNGVICFHMVKDGKFHLWNPMSNKSTFITSYFKQVLAYAFYQDSSPPNHMRVLVFGGNRVNSSVSLERYSTLDHTWETLIPAVTARASKIRGPGMRSAGAFYWPCYANDGRMECLIMFDTCTSNLETELIFLEGYDFKCRLINAVPLQSVLHIICSRKVQKLREVRNMSEVERSVLENVISEGGGDNLSVTVTKSDILRRDEEGRWELLCTSPSDTLFLDVLKDSRYLLRCRDSINIVNKDLAVLAQFPFDEGTCSLSFVFDPNFNDAFFQDEKPKKSPIKKMKELTSGMMRLGSKRWIG